MLSILALLLAASQAAAQPATPTVPDAQTVPTTTDDVLVSARTAEAVDRFVAALTQVEVGRQVARWDGRLCVRVLGLPEGQASFLQAQIGQVAKQERLPVAAQPCRADVIVVVTADATGFATAMTHRYPRLFTQGYNALQHYENVQATVAARAAFRREHPVRLVTSTRTVSALGGAFAQGVNLGWLGSRLSEATKEVVLQSFLVVDANDVHGVTWNQLAAYLVMTALTRPDLDAAYNRDTILGLFQARDQGLPAPATLTKSDHAFLDGLYTGSGAKSVRAQREAIAHRVMQATESTAAP